MPKIRTYTSDGRFKHFKKECGECMYHLVIKNKGGNKKNYCFGGEYWKELETFGKIEKCAIINSDIKDRAYDHLDDVLYEHEEIVKDEEVWSNKK